MATTRTWVGGARTQNMVQTITVGSNTDTHTFLIHIAHPSGAGLEAITIASDTASSDTTASIAAELYAQLSASTHEFARRVSWSYPGSGAVITATAVYAGEPFVITETGTGTLTIATTTANAGPHDWNTAGNWAEGAVPVASDDVTIQGGFDILYGLDQSALSDGLDTVQIVNYTGRIGWRGLPLTIDIDDELFCDFTGQFNWRFASAGPCTIAHVYNTGSKEGLCISGTTGSPPTITTAKIYGGKVQVGLSRAEKAYITHCHVTGGDLTVFDQSWLVNVYQTGGEIDNQDPGNGITLIKLDGGIYRTCTSATLTAVVQNGGEFDWYGGTGTITAYTLNGGVLEGRRGRTVRTITTLTQDQAGTARFTIDASANFIVTTHTRNGPIEYRGIGDQGL